MRRRRFSILVSFILIFASIFVLFTRIVFENADKPAVDQRNLPRETAAVGAEDRPKTAQTPLRRNHGPGTPDGRSPTGVPGPGFSSPKAHRSPKTITIIDQTCYGLCPPNITVDQGEYVARMIKRRSHTLNLPIRTNHSSTVYVTRHPRRRDWTIRRAELFGQGGTQPKVILHLIENGLERKAVFKPKLNSRYTREHPCYGFDRSAGELGAYYLRRTLNNFVHTTGVIGIRLNLKREIWPLRRADGRLHENTWVLDDDPHRYCMLFQCKYCEDLVICGDDDHKSSIDGSMSFWAEETLKQIENPWSGTCTQKGAETWRTDRRLCKKILSDGGDGFYGDRRVLVDVIDAGIFDYLVDNPDRHTFEYWENGTSSGKVLVLLDNGKAFPDPSHNDANILAALFQCCMIRRRSYETLLEFSDEAYFEASFVSWMMTDPTFPFLDEAHAGAVSRRIRRTIALIELCIEKYGRSAVLVEEK